MAYDPQSVASYYAALFPARSDVYSNWTPGGWRPVREPLTGDIVLAGLTGKGPSISGYMIAPGSTTHVLAIDFDTDDGLEQAFILARLMGDNSLPAYVETSRRGAHLWCILDAVLPARVVRAAARALLQAADLPADDPHIEIRPGSDILSDEGLGHALRLPLMPHPKTGKSGRFLDAGGDPVGRTLAEIILNMDLASGASLAGWAERWKRPPVEQIPAKHRNPNDFPEDDSSVSEILRDSWGVVNAAPGRVVSCPAKEYHSHGDIHKGLKIMPDDRRAICYKAGCILHKDGHGRGSYELRKLAPRQ